MSLSKSQVRGAWTSVSFTRDFRHLQPVPRHWTRRLGWFDPKIHVVKPKDRIKYWNIVPGDQVRLRGDPDGRIYEVNMVNKLSNRVMLKVESDAKNTTNSDEAFKRGRKNVPYAMCQLFVGRFEFPAKGDSPESRTLPVFASRLATTAPFWRPLTHRYEWQRYAVNTVPRLPHIAEGEKERVHISWPKKEKPSTPKTTPYNTDLDAVLEVTYIPPTSVKTRYGDIPAAPSEQEYIRALSAPEADAYDPTKPYEIFVSKELANPHSRAKKQARWQAHLEHKRALLNELVAAEVKELQGRTRREARAEATWKWRHQLEAERKAELKRRWKNRGAEAALARKSVRNARKEAKQREKLRTLVLPQAPNQVTPAAESRVA